MSKRYSGKSFKDSSVSKKPKLSLKEKRKQKKIIQKHLVLQTTLSILEENLQKVHPQIQKKKALVQKERKNLRAEIVDLKTLALKNTVKKELNLKIF